MKQNILCFFFVNGISFYCLTATSPTLAQQNKIVPDATLPNNSVVTSQDNISTIIGGTIAGGNLFHSFKQFNIDEGHRADFVIRSAAIENILVRVTGGSRSEIMGTLSTSGLSEPNLFLINPNGIVFGPDASLDIRGSFVGTTANAIEFGNQGFFSASTTNNPELLTVRPSAFLFNQIAAGSITNQSKSGLEVPAGQSLLLVGGDVSLDSGVLSAPGGRVELGGVAGSGRVDLKTDGNNLGLSFLDSVVRTNVSLTNAGIYAQKGGSIAIKAQNLFIEGSPLEAGIESVATRTGDITLEAKEAITIKEGSSITNNVNDNAQGNTGGIYIKAGSVLLTDDTTVGAISYGLGETGGVFVQANYLVSKNSSILTQAGKTGVGNGGNISIQAEAISLTDDTRLQTTTFREGHAGDVMIDARTISVDNSYIISEAHGSGNGGIIDIKAGALSLTQGAELSSSTDGKGNGGKIQVYASDSISISGTNARGLYSGLLAQTFSNSTGNGGNINISTNNLDLRDGAIISAQSHGEGKAGDITINANRALNLNNGEISATADLSDAGNINIEAPSIRLDNGASINSDTKGEQGNINLNSVDLVLRRGSNITTNAQGSNVIGGNITIDTGVLAAIENSDISADSTDSRGGNVRINAQGIFGTAFRPQLTPESDITARGSNSSLSGTVIINTTGVDPNRGLINLPENPINPSELIANSCIGRSSQLEGRFVITGTGGLPPRPGDAITSPYPTGTVRSLPSSNALSEAPPRSVSVTHPVHSWQRPIAVPIDSVGMNSQLQNRSGETRSQNPVPSTPAPLVEATGWVYGSKGEVILTAVAPTVTPQGSWSTLPACK